ncbi:MAG: mechanosensitive ion channel [Formivibrio sp.]|nr:mechanosensitive ion channel [Formivibrio sp.]
MSTRHNLVSEFYQDLIERGVMRPEMLCQAAVILFALLAAWLLESQLKRHAMAAHPERREHIGHAGFIRVFFPLTALMLTALGEFVLGNWFAQPLKLLTMAEILLMAMVNIRLFVFLLRRAFEGAPWVRSSERILSTVIWTIYALHVLGILPEIAQLLDGIQLHLGKGHVSVLNILQATTSVAATVLAALWLGREVEQRLMMSEVMDMNLRVMVIKVVRPLLIVLAILIALPLVGIDLTVLSVFGGALGVGLGFGLQKIASNYVSGFIILIDRSVKIGDVVQIDNRLGMITQMTSRYIVLKAGDGTEALIPNETLITSTVVNQSYNDRLIRIALPVQVAYGTDLAQAQALLQEAAKVEPRVVDTPAPAVFIKGFGENGIELELGVWIKDPENGQLPVRSSINMKIWQIFMAHAIEIPYPQREVRVTHAHPDPAKNPL